MSELAQTHLPCDDCGSSDALSLYTDGHTYCFSCGQVRDGKENNVEVKAKKKLPIINNSDMSIESLRARGITAATCRKYGYYVTKDEYGNAIQVANYVKNGEVAFQKTRDRDKNFFTRGRKEHIFFGQHLFTGGKKLVITEGEIDALTVSQVQDNKYPVVSLPFGCKSAAETFKEQMDWLSNFESVIVMFDMDKQGQAAVEEVSGILPPRKLKIASLPLKDANECLLANRPSDIINAMWNAREYKPDGIINAMDIKDALFSEEGQIESYNFPWNNDLNKMTLGIRKGELTLMTAGSGIGKSTSCREIAYKLNRADGLKIGMVMLEENPKKTARDLLSVHLKSPLHLTWGDEGTRERALSAYDELFGDGRFVLYDHFGSLAANNLLDKIRYMIVAEGCDFVILDHISIAVSGIDSDKNDVKILDMLMTNLRSIVEETGAGLVVISHLRKVESNGCPFEEGGSISMDDLRGSGALKQLSDTILAFERNQQAEDENQRHQLRIRVLKCRFSGDTGLTKDVLQFNKTTNRMEEVDPLTIEKQTESDNKCEIPF